MVRAAPEWRRRSTGEASALQCRPLPPGDRRGPLGTVRALSDRCAHRRAGKDVAGCADPRSVAPWPPAKRSAHRRARHHPARTARPLVHVGAGHHPAARCAPAVRDRRLPNTPVILAEADGRVAAACPRARATVRRAGASRGLCGGGADGGRPRCPCMRVWQVAGPSRGAKRAAGWWPCVTFGRAGRAGVVPSRCATELCRGSWGGTTGSP